MDLKYDDMMAAIAENQNINQIKPILFIEGPKGSSGYSQAPPVAPTPPILMPTIEIQYVREEYGPEIVYELNLQPCTCPLSKSFPNSREPVAEGTNAEVIEVESLEKAHVEKVEDITNLLEIQPAKVIDEETTKHIER